MQALILAAGCGRRMGLLSEACHKALTRLGRSTIVERMIDELLSLNIVSVTVVTGYQAEQLEGYLTAAYPDAPLRFIRNERFADTNNVVSLALALEQMDRGADLLLVECDLILAPGILAGLSQTDRGNVALVDFYRAGMNGTVVSIADGRLTDVYPASAQGEDFDYREKYKTMNVYRFTDRFRRETLQPLVVAHAERFDATAYYEDVFAGVADLAALNIAAQVVGEALWAEIDDPADLAAAQFRFLPEDRASILDRRMGGHWELGLLDFSFMRNVHFPPPAMWASLRHGLVELLGDYGSSQAVVNEKLGWFLGCPPSRLCALSGASQAFPILRQLWHGLKVAIPAPAFGEYARVFPAALTYNDAPGVELDEVDQLANEVQIVVVVNPNSPTGTTIATAAIYGLAARHPRTFWLVDESFIDFSAEPTMRTALEARPLSNVAILTSLSKSLGMPGMRLGYLYSQNGELLEAVSGELPIWHIGSPAEFVLEQTLKYRPELLLSWQQTIADREAMTADLQSIDGVLRVYPSGGDFVLLELQGPLETGASLRRRLLAEEAMEIKDVTGRFPDRVPRVRVAVRLPEENARLAAALRKWLPRLRANRQAQ